MYFMHKLQGKLRDDCKKKMIVQTTTTTLLEVEFDGIQQSPFVVLCTPPPFVPLASKEHLIVILRSSHIRSIIRYPFRRNRVFAFRILRTN